MKTPFGSSLPALLVLLLAMALSAGENTHEDPYLGFNGVSDKNLAASAASAPWSVLHRSAPPAINDTLMVIALRAEFAPDSESITTGNGMFGIYRNNIGCRDDINEFVRYPDSRGLGGSYVFDVLPHDSLYFAGQLATVSNYFRTVSNGRMVVDYAVYPSGTKEQDAYRVPHSMLYYSPGQKIPSESWNDYYFRRTQGLMRFVKDAITAADSADNSPLRAISADTGSGKNALYWTDPADTSIHRKAAILVFHAGASFLTDGGYMGSAGQNSPADMIDVFVSPDFFGYFADSVPGIERDTRGLSGIRVNRNAANEFTLDELMLCSETSNQDSLNWGIRGILVNQIARQLGIPDLYSTMSGVSGVGGFCMMDFAGYSAGQGFVPPWPSAWVRAYMGWDTPIIAGPGSAPRIRALSAAKLGVDTTTVLVPINNHEYYLIENRQRNLWADPSIFAYDTAQGTDGRRDTAYISPFNRITLKKLIHKAKRSTTAAVPDTVLNYDAALPASGILVWHVDEDIIRERIAKNVVNADSSFRGISLVEADGVVDLGIMYRDVFYNPTYDYGGAEDVFPHKASKDHNSISAMGPLTRPDTRSNDGGHTWLSLTFTPAGKFFAGISAPELSRTRGYFTANTPDSLFTVSISRDNSAVTQPQGWPLQVTRGCYDPLPVEIFSDNGDTGEVALLDSNGALFIVPWNASKPLGTTLFINASISWNDTLRDTVSGLGRIGKPLAMPSAIDGAFVVPIQKGLLFITAVDSTGILDSATLATGAAPASYACGNGNGAWALGCENGTLVLGSGHAITQTIQAGVQPLTAIAALDTLGTFAAINNRGMLYTVKIGSAAVLDSINTAADTTITRNRPDFKLAAADFENDGAMEIAVLDNRQRLTVRRSSAGSLSIPELWNNRTVDMPAAYRADTALAEMPHNQAAPAIADIDGDGVLDILVSGTNGIYTFNNRGVALPGWPAFLDRYFWYQKTSVRAAPLVALTPDAAPLTIFSSPSGDNVTFAVARITSSNKKRGVIFFTRADGTQDSLKGLTGSLIDSLELMGDSLVLPYVLPGGFIDALGADARRPDTLRYINRLAGEDRQSNWPLTTGSAITTPPLLCDIDHDGRADLLAVSDAGWLFGWTFSPALLDTSPLWPCNGGGPGRSFRYSGKLSTQASTGNTISWFYSYPNPMDARTSGGTDGRAKVTFKYEIGNDARSVSLSIWTYTGRKVYEQDGLPTERGFNEWSVDVADLGSAVYRCRLSVDFDGASSDKTWKMVIIR